MSAVLVDDRETYLSSMSTDGKNNGTVAFLSMRWYRLISIFTDRRPFEQEKGPLKAFVRIDLRRPEIIMNQKHNDLSRNNKLNFVSGA